MNTPRVFSLSVWPVVGYGSWFEHVQEFWEHRMDSNVLFLKYEDMYKVQYMCTPTDQHMPCHAANIKLSVHTHSLNEWTSHTPYYETHFKGFYCMHKTRDTDIQSAQTNMLCCIFMAN